MAEPHCPGCMGYIVTADPELTGEPGEPYQLPCPGLDAARAAAPLDGLRDAIDALPVVDVTLEDGA